MHEHIYILCKAIDPIETKLLGKQRERESEIEIKDDAFIEVNL